MPERSPVWQAVRAVFISAIVLSVVLAAAWLIDMADGRLGHGPLPSGIDEETFQRVFGRSDWAVMFILARGGETYARLRFNAGPGGDVIIPVRVDYSAPFVGTDHEAWAREYEPNVRAESIVAPSIERGRFGADESDAVIEQPAGQDPFSPEVCAGPECGVEVPW